MSDEGDKTAQPPRPAATQLTLDLSLPPNLGRDDFLDAPSNAVALAAIERWPDWRERTLLLVGPPGSGKSHLCAIWSERAGALALSPAALPNLEALSALRPAALALDGLNAVADETALFHLLNFVNESGASLLVAARRLPTAEEIRLPDLLSRLRRAPVVEIGAPDDDLMRAVLVKLFSDRQLLIDASVVDYIALRLERSLDAARAIVREIDREALARGRRVTRVLAGEVLERVSVG